MCQLQSPPKRARALGSSGNARRNWLAVLAAMAWCSISLGHARADEPPQRKSFPKTRTELKQALESLKSVAPRFPLPEEKVEGDAPGKRPSVHNGRTKSHFLPRRWYASDFALDPEMKLDPMFKVRCFWLVSRLNDCHYCLGHQEHRLSAAGVPDDELAALDLDWSTLPKRLQVALAFTRKLTLEPHAISAEDIDALRGEFNDREILELAHTVAFYNNSSRWTHAMGLPQDKQFHFDSPTTAKLAALPSTVLPQAPIRRPPLESMEQVEAALALARKRKARVSLPDETAARGVLQSAWVDRPSPVGPRQPREAPKLAFDDQPLSAAVRAMLAYPFAGRLQLATWQEIERGEADVPPLLRAQVAWASARHNRAWYALGEARARLKALDQTAEKIWALDRADSDLAESTRAAVEFTRALTVAPGQVGDREVKELRKHFSDRQAAQLVYLICAANQFDRLTESLHLPLER